MRSGKGTDATRWRIGGACEQAESGGEEVGALTLDYQSFRVPQQLGNNAPQAPQPKRPQYTPNGIYTRVQELSVRYMRPLACWLLPESFGHECLKSLRRLPQARHAARTPTTATRPGLKASRSSASMGP